MTVRRRLLPLLRGTLVAQSLLAAAATAKAECAPGAGPWVSLSFADSAWPQAFRANVLADFRARLAEENIAVCTAAEAPARPPVARITISSQSRTSVDVSVDLNDAITAKRVGRDVDLSRVPADGRPLAIAVAAGELLRASWVELALAAPPSPPRAPPPEVRRAVQRALPAPAAAARRVRFGLLAAGERFAGGQTQAGADAAFSGYLAPRLRTLLAAGARQSLTVDAEHGEVLGSSLGVGLGAALVVWQRPHSAELTLGVASRFAFARFRGRARDGASEGDFSGLAIYARLGVGAALRLVGPLWLDAGVSGGVPLRSLSAEDAGRRVTAMSGLEAAGRLGVGVEF